MTVQAYYRKPNKSLGVIEVSGMDDESNSKKIDYVRRGISMPKAVIMLLVINNKEKQNDCDNKN